MVAPADPTEMFPSAGNRTSTPGFAVTGIISRPFPNGSLTTPCLIRQSVTTVSEASGTAARCHSVLKSSYGQFSLTSFCRISKRLSSGRVICFSLISMCIVETRLELMFSNEAIICQKIGFFFFLRENWPTPHRGNGLVPLPGQPRCHLFHRVL